MMATLVVGQCYPRWRGVPEGYRVAIDAGGIELQVMMVRPSAAEVGNYSAGTTVEVRFTPVGPGIGFWVFRFGSEDWADAPYSAGLTVRGHTARPVIPQITDGGGLTVRVILADTVDGRLCRIRTFSLGTAISRYVRQWCADCPDVTPDGYDRAITAAYQRFTPDDLARLAPGDARWTVVGSERGQR